MKLRQRLFMEAKKKCQGKDEKETRYLYSVKHYDMEYLLSEKCSKFLKAYD